MQDILGQRLAALRRQQGFSQRALARAVDISQKHLSQLEKGHQPLLSLSSATLCKLAALLHVSMDYLAGRYDDDTTQSPTT